MDPSYLAFDKASTQDPRAGRRSVLMRPSPHGLSTARRGCPACRAHRDQRQLAGLRLL